MHSAEVWKDLKLPFPYFYDHMQVQVFVAWPYVTTTPNGMCFNQKYKHDKLRIIFFFTKPLFFEHYFCKFGNYE